MIINKRRAITCVWMVFLLPWSGLLIYNSTFDPSYYFVTPVTCTYLFVTLIATFLANRFMIGFLWFVSGVIWLTCNWVKINYSKWGSDEENFTTAIIVWTVAWVVTVAVPSVLTIIDWWCKRQQEPQQGGQSGQSTQQYRVSYFTKINDDFRAEV